MSLPTSNTSAILDQDRMLEILHDAHSRHPLLPLPTLTPFQQSIRDRIASSPGFRTMRQEVFSTNPNTTELDIEISLVALVIQQEQEMRAQGIPLPPPSQTARSSGEAAAIETGAALAIAQYQQGKNASDTVFGLAPLPAKASTQKTAALTEAERRILQARKRELEAQMKVIKPHFEEQIAELARRQAAGGFGTGSGSSPSTTNMGNQKATTQTPTSSEVAALVKVGQLMIDKCAAIEEASKLGIDTATTKPGNVSNKNESEDVDEPFIHSVLETARVIPSAPPHIANAAPSTSSEQVRLQIQEQVKKSAAADAQKIKSKAATSESRNKFTDQEVAIAKAQGRQFLAACWNARKVSHGAYLAAEKVLFQEYASKAGCAKYSDMLHGHEGAIEEYLRVIGHTPRLKAEAMRRLYDFQLSEMSPEERATTEKMKLEEEKKMRAQENSALISKIGLDRQRGDYLHNQIETAKTVSHEAFIAAELALFTEYASKAGIKKHPDAMKKGPLADYFAYLKHLDLEKELGEAQRRLREFHLGQMTESERNRFACLFAERLANQERQEILGMDEVEKFFMEEDDIFEESKPKTKEKIKRLPRQEEVLKAQFEMKQAGLIVRKEDRHRAVVPPPATEIKKDALYETATAGMSAEELKVFETKYRKYEAYIQGPVYKEKVKQEQEKAYKEYLLKLNQEKDKAYGEYQFAVKREEPLMPEVSTPRSEKEKEDVVFKKLSAGMNAEQLKTFEEGYRSGQAWADEQGLSVQLPDEKEMEENWRLYQADPIGKTPEKDEFWRQYWLLLQDLALDAKGAETNAPPKTSTTALKPLQSSTTSRPQAIPGTASSAPTSTKTAQWLSRLEYISPYPNPTSRIQISDTVDRSQAISNTTFSIPMAAASIRSPIQPPYISPYPTPFSRHQISSQIAPLKITEPALSSPHVSTATATGDAKFRSAIAPLDLRTKPPASFHGQIQRVWADKQHDAVGKDDPSMLTITPLDTGSRPPLAPKATPVPSSSDTNVIQKPPPKASVTSRFQELGLQENTIPDIPNVRGFNPENPTIQSLTNRGVAKLVTQPPIPSFSSTPQLSTPTQPYSEILPETLQKIQSRPDFFHPTLQRRIFYNGLAVQPHHSPILSEATYHDILHMLLTEPCTVRETWTPLCCRCEREPEAFVAEDRFIHLGLEESVRDEWKMQGCVSLAMGSACLDCWEKDLEREKKRKEKMIDEREEESEENYLGVRGWHNDDPCNPSSEWTRAPFHPRSSIYHNPLLRLGPFFARRKRQTAPPPLPIHLLPAPPPPSCEAPMASYLSNIPRSAAEPKKSSFRAHHEPSYLLDREAYTSVLNGVLFMRLDMRATEEDARLDELERARDLENLNRETLNLDPTTSEFNHENIDYAKLELADALIEAKAKALKSNWVCPRGCSDCLGPAATEAMMRAGFDIDTDFGTEAEMETLRNLKSKLGKEKGVVDARGNRHSGAQTISVRQGDWQSCRGYVMDMETPVIPLDGGSGW